MLFVDYTKENEGQPGRFPPFQLLSHSFVLERDRRGFNVTLPILRLGADLRSPNPHLYFALSVLLLLGNGIVLLQASGGCSLTHDSWGRRRTSIQILLGSSATGLRTGARLVFGSRPPFRNNSHFGGSLPARSRWNNLQKRRAGGHCRGKSQLAKKASPENTAPPLGSNQAKMVLVQT